MTIDQYRHDTAQRELLLAVIKSQAETISQLSETISKLVLRTAKKQ